MAKVTHQQKRALCKSLQKAEKEKIEKKRYRPFGENLFRYGILRQKLILGGRGERFFLEKEGFLHFDQHLLKSSRIGLIARTSKLV